MEGRKMEERWKGRGDEERGEMKEEVRWKGWGRGRGDGKEGGGDIVLLADSTL